MWPWLECGRGQEIGCRAALSRRDGVVGRRRVGSPAKSSSDVKTARLASTQPLAPGVPRRWAAWSPARESLASRRNHFATRKLFRSRGGVNHDSPAGRPDLALGGRAGRSTGARRRTPPPHGPATGPSGPSRPETSRSAAAMVWRTRRCGPVAGGAEGRHGPGERRSSRVGASTRDPAADPGRMSAIAAPGPRRRPPTVSGGGRRAGRRRRAIPRGQVAGAQSSLSCYGS
jgi:hypothetical protein